MTDPISNPQNFPWRLDIQRGTIDFLDLGREMLAAAAFLDHRAPGANRPKTSMQIAAVQSAQASAVKPRPPAYIFHTAFCSSTLISRCLDMPGHVLALKEPQILMDLSGARRFEGQRGQSMFPDMLRLVNNLLARPREGNERAVIKPSNGANDLLFDVLDLEPETQILALFTDIRPFLISVIKRGEIGRYFVRTLLHHPWGADQRIRNLPPEQALQFTDLQAAALVWRLQTDAFSKALAKYPASRIRALNADDFHNDPRGALAALDVFLNLNLGADRVRTIAQGPLLAQDAKHKDRNYDASIRKDEQRAVEEEYGADLNSTITWAQKLSFPPAAPLASTLLR
jgi:hypothetical protein